MTSCRMTASPVLEIVEAIADEKGVDSEKLDLILEEHVSTDAIRLLAAHETETWTLRFEIPDHEVTVKSDGVILVDGSKQEVWA